MKKCRFMQMGFLLKRPVFMAPGPEAGKEAAEAVTKAPVVKKEELEDRSKRQEVYDIANAKADEYLKSEDPRKREMGEKLKKDVEQALKDEAALDVSIAKTTAIGLLGRLERIAMREKRAAKPVKEEEVARLVKGLESAPPPEWVTKKPEGVQGPPEPTPQEKADREKAIAAMTEAAPKPFVEPTPEESAQRMMAAMEREERPVAPEEKPAAPPVKVAEKQEKPPKPPKG